MSEIIKGEYLVGGGIGCDGVVVYKNNIIDNEYLDDNCKQIYVDSYLVEECNNFCEKKDCIYTSDEMIRCGLYDPNSNSLIIDTNLISVGGNQCPDYAKNTNLQECICNMCDLEKLKIIGTNPITFQKCMINLPYLSILIINGEINDFAEFVEIFKYKLTTLYLDGSFKNSEIPYQIGEFTKLENLRISDNFSAELSLPDSISNLVNLRYLDLSSNWKLSELPDSIQNLTKLKYIVIKNTGLDKNYVQKLLPNTTIIS